MATIRICDKCGVRPPESWYGLSVYEYNEDCRKIQKSTAIDLCHQCYKELVADFDLIRRNTPSVEVRVVE